MEDLYKNLGLNKDATKKEIKKAYRELSKKHHPDKGGDEEEFKKISKAYKVLSDDERREAYDNGRDYESIETLSDKARDMVFGFIDSSINSFGFVPDHSDLIGAIRGRINEDIRKLQNAKEQAGNDIRHYEGTIKRVKKGELLKIFLQNRVSDIQGDIKRMDGQNDVLNKCIEMIKDWEYDYEQDNEPINGSTEYRGLDPLGRY